MERSTSKSIIDEGLKIIGSREEAGSKKTSHETQGITEHRQCRGIRFVDLLIFSRV